MSEQAYDYFEEWALQWPDNTPETVRSKWDSLQPPYAVGWEFLAKMAGESSGESSFAAQHEFDVVDTSSDPPTDLEAAMDAMFARYVWAEQPKCVVDLTDLSMLDKEVFNARLFAVGDPSDGKKSAWAKFMRLGELRRTVRGVTYRPGAGLFVQEMDGECVNLWKAGAALPEEVVSDSEIKPWLDHLAYVLPDAQERAVLMDWMAWVAQNQAEKPNWGVLMGGAHGTGKSTLIEPLRIALGYRNVREIGPSDLESGYTGWLAQTKLFVVEEMHAFERKAMMQRLKNFLAAPPYTLQINPKFGRQFEIPNLIAGVFFTNHENALALEKGDRRFYVLWSNAEPREKAYYDGLVDWYRAGGGTKAALWLLARQLKGFDAKGRAPDTSAKEEMRQATRSAFDEAIEDAMRYEEGPFAARLVSVADVKDWLPADIGGPKSSLSSARIAAALRRAGARALGQTWIPKETSASGERERVSLFSVRGHEIIANLMPTEQVKLYQTEKARLMDKKETVLRDAGF